MANVWGSSEGDRSLFIIGAGGHAVSVAETAHACGYRISAFVDDTPRVDELLGRPVISGLLEGIPPTSAVVVAIGSNFGRAAVWNRLHETSGAYRFPVLIHPSASVAFKAVIDPGSVVMQGAVVGNLAHIGLGCILNSGSIVEHECVLGDFSSLAPRAVLGGRVKVGERSAVGIGAVVREGVQIGPDAVLGAAALATRDIPAAVVAFGVPARVERLRNASDPYMK